jgi:hypothetical protein
MIPQSGFSKALFWCHINHRYAIFEVFNRRNGEYTTPQACSIFPPLWSDMTFCLSVQLDQSLQVCFWSLACVGVSTAAGFTVFTRVTISQFSKKITERWVYFAVIILMVRALGPRQQMSCLRGLRQDVPYNSNLARSTSSSILCIFGSQISRSPCPDGAVGRLTN